MKTILVTAYAVNPYKGSEDAMGWNMVLQICRYNKAIVVTRRNNGADIGKYLKDHPELSKDSRLTFLFFDWPKWMIWWKKGPMLSLIYFYGWQFTLALWLKMKNFKVDLVHNLNFHNDWTPSFLWILNKPMVWGHVGHHSKIPKAYILPVYGMLEFIKDRALWLVKNIFWYLDPFLYISKIKADMVICMNAESVKKLRLKENFIIHPSVAAGEPVDNSRRTKSESFHVISVGRFVSLKGFDLCIRSFAAFYKDLNPDQRKNTTLKLIGAGPSKKILLELARAEEVGDAIEFIDWLPREKLSEIYATSNVFLFPSHEGAGMVVPEAMSYGLPVICLKNTGPGQLIHPESKLSVDYSTYPETIELLSGMLRSLKYNPCLMDSERKLTDIRFKSLLNWNVRGEMLKKVYTDILTETPKIQNHEIA
jgi:glycosyltransferase involved in cell wall biosynthesis